MVKVTTLVDLSKATNAELQIAADREGICFLSSKMCKICDALIITEPERTLLEQAVRDRGFKTIYVNLEARVNSRNVAVDGHVCCLGL